MLKSLVTPSTERLRESTLRKLSQVTSKNIHTFLKQYEKYIEIHINNLNLNDIDNQGLGDIRLVFNKQQDLYTQDDVNVKCTLSIVYDIHYNKYQVIRRGDPVLGFILAVYIFKFCEENKLLLIENSELTSLLYKYILTCCQELYTLSDSVIINKVISKMYSALH